MSEAKQIDSFQARERMEAGGALLVCAYETEAKFKKTHLEGAVSRPDFNSRYSPPAQGQEIIVYCA